MTLTLSTLKIEKKNTNNTIYFINVFIQFIQLQKIAEKFMYLLI